MMQIPTMEDFLRVEQKIDQLQRSLAELQEKKQLILTTEDIMLRLKISLRTFHVRKPGLIRFGMFQQGRLWRMKEADFNNYLDNYRGM